MLFGGSMRDLAVKVRESESKCRSFVQETVDNVLEDVSLDIPPGTVLAVTGESGAGKTTLVRLALALVAPRTETVTFYHAGGTEQANAATRRHIAYVPQGITLLSGSVADSLREGKNDATEAEMWEALERAEAAGFIRESPEGLDSAILENAGGFSEGQAQRIAIARALIKNAPVLIFDEATSALDSETESRILPRLASMERRPTCLIITHRRAMLRFCDRAVETSGGRVNEIPITDRAALI